MTVFVGLSAFLQCITHSSNLQPQVNPDQCVDGLQNNVCLKPTCIETASDILSTIDESVNPCVDFNKFMCGRWEESNPLPEDKSSYSPFTKTSEKMTYRIKAILESKDEVESYPGRMAKVIYQKCMDIKSIEKAKSEPLRKVLKKLGGWPLFGDKMKSKLSLAKLLALVAKEGHTSVLFSHSVSVDLMNNTHYVAQIDAQSLPYPREFYLDKKYQEQINILKTFMGKLLKIYGEDIGRPLDDLGNDVDDMMQFETGLAKLSLTRVEARNATKVYNKYTLSTLKREFSWIDWDEYLSIIYPPDVLSAIGDNHNFIVSSPSYMKGLIKLLLGTRKRVIHNYFNLRVLIGWVSYLDQRYSDAVDDFQKQISGSNATPPRWKSCLQVAKGGFGFAVGAAYVNRHFSEYDKKQAVELVASVASTFDDIISESTWMDETTKLNAHKKAANMLQKVAYPDYLKNATSVNEEYPKLSLDTDAGYFDFFKQYSTWATNRNIRTLLTTVDRTKFDMGVAIVNAAYSPTQNAMIIPDGILQQPFFDSNNPMYMNFGGIGMVIGHEITHGFDDQGKFL